MNRISWKSEWAPLARRFADKVAITDGSGDVTYQDLYAAAAGVAGRLIAEGVAPGQAVATMIPNSRYAVAASLGVALAGAAEAPINPASSADEAAHCLGVSRAQHLITEGTAGAGFAGRGVTVLRVESFEPGAMDGLPDIHVDPATWGRIMFTSGTTGKPKGIVHSHGGRWLANVLQRATLPVAAVPGRRILLMTPYAHGASLLTQAFLDGGGSVVLLNGVDPAVTRRLLLAGEVDQIFAPPTVLAKLVDIVGDECVAGISAIFTGTAPLPRELYWKAREIFGPVVRITFGKTEVFNPITVLTAAETDRWFNDPRSAWSACVGWPASGVEVAVESDASDAAEEGREASGEQPRVGPVLIRAQHMLVATLTADGVVEHQPDAFHWTGDLGFIDGQGRLHLVGREADVIKTGGYRVTPEEIEGHLRAALPGGELVVVGLPSSYWGEVITAVAAGAPAGWREALAPALAAMTRYKQPRLFAEVPEISRNAMGKIVRSRTRDVVLARYRFIDGRYPALEPRLPPVSDG